MANTKRKPLHRRADALRGQGFDETTCDGREGTIRPRCSQCEVAVINGVACHETGCPNARRGRDNDEDSDDAN